MVINTLGQVLSLQRAANASTIYDPGCLVPFHGSSTSFGKLYLSFPNQKLTLSYFTKTADFKLLLCTEEDYYGCFYQAHDGTNNAVGAAPWLQFESSWLEAIVLTIQKIARTTFDQWEQELLSTNRPQML
jgi:hypothetical protein